MRKLGVWAILFIIACNNKDISFLSLDRKISSMNSELSKKVLERAEYIFCSKLLQSDQSWYLGPGFGGQGRARLRVRLLQQFKGFINEKKLDIYIPVHPNAYYIETKDDSMLMRLSPSFFKKGSDYIFMVEKFSWGGGEPDYSIVELSGFSIWTDTPENRREIERLLKDLPKEE
jgi:hypothetical protein